jgi:phage shock protein PspC (stress-responsive transcriptional regulator)
MSSPIPIRRLYRDPANRAVAGVASGIAKHLGAPVMLVRAAFVVLAMSYGLGAIMYAAFWAVLPLPANAQGGKRNFVQLLSFLALGAGALLVIDQSGQNGMNTAVGWLAATVAFGAGIIWHQADPKRRMRWSVTVPQMPWLGSVLD